MNLPRVSDVVAPWDRFDRVPPGRLEMACMRGTVVHSTLCCIAKGLWHPPTPDIYRGYVESGSNWLNKYVLEIHLVETTLYDEDMGYRGTLDIIVTMTDNIMTLTDWKTPKAKSKMWVARMSAYRHLAIKNGYPVKKVGTLRLKEDGSDAIFDPHPLSEHDFVGFHAALVAHRFFNL